MAGAETAARDEVYHGLSPGAGRPGRVSSFVDPARRQGCAVSYPVPLPTPDQIASYRLGKLDAFFGVPPGDTAAALAQARDPDRAALVSRLRVQADRFGAPGAARTNLERLSDPNARVVVTGQQTGLLLGPTYTISKALSAVRLAARLDTRDRPVIPVFWMASQDHDVAEVDHAFLLGMDERLLRLHVDLPDGAPTGAIAWEPGWLDSVIEAIHGVDVPAVHREEVLGLLRTTAEHAETFAGWFGSLLSRLLGPAGLVVLDPLDQVLAEQTRPVLEAELADPRASAEAIESAGERLRRCGIEPQLGRAENATNLFVTEHLDGRPRRVLLRRTESGFRTERSTYSRDDLMALLDEDAARITPAAGLRPVTQDVLLPTVATVVGPGELRYFAQLKGVYELHGVDMPLIWPRATATIVEPPVRRILQVYDLDVPTYFAAPAAHRERAILVRNDAFDRFADALAALDRDTRALLSSVSVVDPSLRRTVERSHRTLERMVERLRSKTATALAREDEITTRQFDRLEAHLLPRGVHQERVISPFSYFLKFGIEPVMSAFATLPEEGDHVLVI